jgi:transcriptional regulator with XRE-family HTH domain
MPPSRSPLKIGARLRAVRTESGLTLDQVANATGLTKGFISRIERDGTSPSVQTLVALCEAMSIPVGWLFEAPDVSLVRQEDASAIISISGHTGQEYLLTPRAQSAVQVIRSVYKPGQDGGDELYTLGADVEVAHVIDGRLEIIFATTQEELAAGDTLTFHGHEPHTWRNPDPHAKCVVLWTLVPSPWVSVATPSREISHNGPD